MTGREIVIGLIAAALLSAAGYLFSIRISLLESDKRALTAELNTANSTIDEIQAQQNKAAELDKRATEKLHASESENNRLRNELATANRKLYIKAKCPATSTGSVGDDASVELTGASGQAVFDIRAGIIRDRAKIEYLQGYIKNVCLSQ
ncbi:lysis protein [Limnobaculum zhutongyuii]|uniref:Lysis protein n=1 Tax=Limnobaculum zhutongyuii TaxID=2498113 RepID=A0A411WLQ0_9GAMM|nr:lysis protein [Limnobaculum zhutongyuii]QBH97171.1 lysis protein [Limnobaculum zhutongyuii]TQS88430.1 lysis protein [Limnobaculum zhutongyuii]